MPEYYFRGRDTNGELREGERFSDNIDELNKTLTLEGITPIDIKIKGGNIDYSVEGLFKQFIKPRVSKAEVSILMHQLQLLSEAHVPILTGLELLSQHTKNTALKAALTGICTNLQKGQDVATAMSAYPNIFTNFMTNMIGIGEKMGNLTNTFSQIHQYLDFEIMSMKKLKETLRYPALLFLTLTATILSINLFVIPTFAKVYSQLNTQLPWQTELLIACSNFLVNDGIYLLIGLFILAFLLFRYLKTPAGKYHYHSLILKIPIFGQIIRRIILIRFAKTLSIVLNSGMTILDGMRYTEEIVMNDVVKSQISEACDLIERGTSFVVAISKIKLFSPLEVQMIVVGEQNGKLGPALSYITSFHSNEIDYELKRLQELLGPILVAIFSVIILIVSLGVYLPLWNLSSAIH